MRAYLMTTGLIFLAIVLAHILRMLAESTALARDPAYLALTLAAAGLSSWAWYLLRRTAGTRR